MTGLSNRRTLIPLFVSTAFASYLCEDWLAGLAIIVIFAVWHFLRSENKPPVLALALTFQWLQVTAGIFYYGLTGRRLTTMDASNYRPMVMIGLACVVVLLLGILSGISRFKRHDVEVNRSGNALSTRKLLIWYVLAVLLSGIIQQLAWRMPQLTQGILALSCCRYVLLFLLLRKLVWPRFKAGAVIVVLLVEVLLGLTSFFAGFREPLIIATLTFIERFSAHRNRYWVATASLALVMVLLSVVWTGIKPEYRSGLKVEGIQDSRGARLDEVSNLAWNRYINTSGTFADDFDSFVDRLWAVYLPALALDRVPSQIEHENGQIMWDAVRNILSPRLFFPDKEGLLSDSEKVRQYSGVWVHGPEENTSFAFGYAGESYVDFGIPLMFVPVFFYGMFMGLFYRLSLRIIRHQDVAVGLTTIVIWLGLYLFERSWAMTLGLTFTLIIFLGAAAFFLDRFILTKRHYYRPVRGAGTVREIARVLIRDDSASLPNSNH